MTSLFEHLFIAAQSPNSRKLLVVLHGRGDSLQGFLWLPQALGIPEANYLLLDAPDAYGPGCSWYNLPPHQGPGILRSRQLLLRLLDELEAKGYAAADIALFGFSQGCLMSIDVGLRTNRRLAAIVGVSGYVFFEEEYPNAFSKEARTQKFLITHGTLDDVLPFERTRDSVARLKSLGVNIDWRAYDKEHTIHPHGEMDDIRSFLRSAWGLG